MLLLAGLLMCSPIAACGGTASSPTGPHGVADAGGGGPAGDTGSDATADIGGGEDTDGGRAEADMSTDAPLPDECQDWQNAHPAWLWCDGFEGDQSLQDKYDDVSDRGLGHSERDAFGGARSLEQRYEPGQVDAGWIGWQVGDAPASRDEPSQGEYFVRWYHKFEGGFEGIPPKMARVRRLEPDWTKRYSVLHWIAPQSDTWPIVLDVYAPDSTQANSAGWLAVARSDFSYRDPVNIGRWICHEMQIKNNTPGQADGVLRVWADGELLVERTDVDLRGHTDGDLNEVMLDAYWNEGSPRAQSRFYDNFVISTARIGCL